MNSGNSFSATPAKLAQVRPVGVADELHQRSSSATACAASPSPRPVKPSPSVVVARTLTSPPSTDLGQPPAHLLAVRGDLRLLADEHAIRVDEHPALLAHLRVGLTQQVEAVGAAEALVARREQRADVAEPGSAEQRVDQRVREHVAVGVAGEAARMVDRHAAEHERHAVDERVRVDTDPDAQSHASTAGSSSSERIAIAPAGRLVQTAPTARDGCARRPCPLRAPA